MENIKPYEKYKPSGITWLGDIPEHWSHSQLKYLTTKIVDGAHFTPTYVDSGIPFLRVTDIQTKNINLSRIKYIPLEEHLELIKRCNPEKGDVLLSKNGTIGITKIIDWDFDFSIFVSLCLIKLKPTLNPYFFSTLFSSKAVEVQIKEGGQTTSVTNLHLEKIRELVCVLPPLEEQLAVANFLAYKTAKIDRFISKKKQLIKLLNEQKAGIINHVVTKGLHANVKMKPSGIEWLGDIPEHWEVRKLKGILSKEKGALKPGPFGSDLKNVDIISTGFKVYNQRAVLDNNFLISEECISSTKFEALKVFEVLAGDILLTTRGTIGKCCIVPNDFEKGIIHPCIIRLRIETAMVSLQFVKLFIEQANAFKIALKLNSNATTIDVIYGNTLKDIFFVVPPIEEQTTIVSHIEKETDIINKAIATIEKEIALVQEYRTSLIAEAVTGKIDVREYKVPVFEEEDLVYEEVEEEMDMVAEDVEGMEVE